MYSLHLRVELCFCFLKGFHLSSSLVDYSKWLDSQTLKIDIQESLIHCGWRLLYATLLLQKTCIDNSSLTKEIQRGFSFLWKWAKLVFGDCFAANLIETADTPSGESDTTMLLPWVLPSASQHQKVAMDVTCVCEHLRFIYCHLFCAPVSKMCPSVIASLCSFSYESFHRNALLSDSKGNYMPHSLAFFYMLLK